MEITRDIRISIGVLLGFQLLIAFGAIGLLDRMAPAIHQILDENVAAMEASQEMLSLLASNNGTMESRKTDFLLALTHLRERKKDPAELRLIERIAETHETALWGDTKAQRETVVAIKEFSDLTKRAMIRADKQARNLGMAGAWAVVFLGFSGFLTGLFVLRRMLSRIADPITGLWETLSAWRKGDFLRRCKSNEGALEIRNSLAIINELLDEHIAPANRSKNGETGKEKAVIVHFLEQNPEAAFVVHEKYGIVAANSRGIAILSRKDGAIMRQELLDACKASAPHESATAGVTKTVKSANSIKNSEHWLCTVATE